MINSFLFLSICFWNIFGWNSRKFVMHVKVDICTWPKSMQHWYQRHGVKIKEMWNLHQTNAKKRRIFEEEKKKKSTRLIVERGIYYVYIYWIYSNESNSSRDKKKIVSGFFLLVVVVVACANKFGCFIW